MDTEHLLANVAKPFGAAVNTWRTRLGISQEELAVRAGMNWTYICDIERGVRNPSLESIVKLAHALEISAATLFSYDTPPKPEQSSQVSNTRQPGNGAIHAC